MQNAHKRPLHFKSKEQPKWTLNSLETLKKGRKQRPVNRFLKMSLENVLQLGAHRMLLKRKSSNTFQVTMVLSNEQNFYRTKGGLIYRTPSLWEWCPETKGKWFILIGRSQT